MIYISKQENKVPEAELYFEPEKHDEVKVPVLPPVILYESNGRTSQSAETGELESNYKVIKSSRWII